jgi:hypothetical protein
MAERSSLTQVVQWGVETSGAPTSGTILMSALGFEPSPKFEGGDFRPSGQKLKTLAWVSKEWTEGALTGQATYNEIIYPLSSVLSRPTTGGSAASGFTYTFAIQSGAPDAPRTFTVEQGEDGNWNQITNLIVKEFGVSVGRDQIQLTGSAYGRAIVQKTVDMSPNPTAPDAVIVLPTDVCVYYGSSYGAITASPSGAKLTRVLNTEFSIGNRYNPVWVLDCDEDSFVASVEAEPEISGSMLVEADTQGMAMMSDVQNANTRYVRIEAISSTGAGTGGAGNPFRLTIDLAVKFKDTPGYSDEDGLYAIGWNLMGINTADVAAIKVEVCNNVVPTAALLS